MTPEAYQQKLQELIKAASQRAVEAVFVPAAKELLGSIINRVTLDGKNSTAGNIGNYSTKEMYATRDQFVKKGAFKPQGKNGTDTVRTFRITNQRAQRTPVRAGQRPRKSMYLVNGYKELRDVQGMPTNNVRAFYSGDLMLSYVLQQETQRIILGLNKESSVKKKKGLEKKFGDFLHATPEELAAYNKNVTEAWEGFVKRVYA